MTGKFDFTSELSKTVPGGQISIPAGEFNGNWIIEKPVYISGIGRSSVLWSLKGPVLHLRSPGIILDSITLEVTGDLDSVSVLIDDNLDPQPSFNNVKIVGKPAGGIFSNNWNIPSVIDFGTMLSNEIVHRTIGINLPRPIKIHADLAGLTIQVDEGFGNQTALVLTFDASIARKGCLIDGLLQIETRGLLSSIRLTGEILTQSYTVANTRHFTQERPKIMDQSPYTSAPPQRTSPKEEPSPITLEINEILRKAIDYEEQELYEKEVQLLENALKSYPMSAELHARMAMAREKTGNLVEACKEWESVYTLSPAFPDIIELLIIIYKKCNKEEALITLYEKLVRNRTADVSIYRALAMLYWKANRKDEAIWALRQAQTMKYDQKLQKLLDLWER